MRAWGLRFRAYRDAAASHGGLAPDKPLNRGLSVKYQAIEPGTNPDTIDGL